MKRGFADVTNRIFDFAAFDGLASSPSNGIGRSELATRQRERRQSEAKKPRLTPLPA
jgi:hypothetical protein